MRDFVLMAPLLPGERLEPLGGEIEVIVSRAHGFGADALLLAAFSAPRGGERALDLGTGCGVVPLFWCRASALSHADGLELQPEGCDQFRRSIAWNRLDGRLCAVCGDLRSWRLPAGEPLYDLIACNPPYYPLAAGAVSVHKARRMARQEEQCSLADVVQAGARLTRFGGRFCLCHKPERLCSVLCEMRAQGLEPKRLRFVAQQAQSAPWLFLLEGRRGGKPGLRVEPLLVMEDASGAVSPEMRAIYGMEGDG